MELDGISQTSATRILLEYSDGHFTAGGGGVGQADQRHKKLTRIFDGHFAVGGGGSGRQGSKPPRKLLAPLHAFPEQRHKHSRQNKTHVGNLCDNGFTR